MGTVQERDPGARGRVLIVDDEPSLLRAIRRLLQSVQYEVVTVSNPGEVLRLLEQNTFDAVVTDLMMPEIDGLTLLQRIHELDRELPVVIITGQPRLETALRAIEQAVFRYLPKPLEENQLFDTIEQAVQMRRLALVEREAMRLFRAKAAESHGRAELSACLDRALRSISVAFQPIVSWSRRATIAYEVLMRSSEPALPNPMAVLDAGERLDRLNDVGRSVRRTLVERLDDFAADVSLFLNIHPADLLDEELFSASAPLTAAAKRIVVEVTERASLDKIPDARARIARARALGFRIAIDDLGAGYAGLHSFAQLEPEVVKIDMLLVRDLDRTPNKRTLVRSILAVAAELGVQVVAEGVETREERNCLVDLGCDLMQGYLFGPPAHQPPIAHLAD